MSHATLTCVRRRRSDSTRAQRVRVSGFLLAAPVIGEPMMLVLDEGRRWVSSIVTRVVADPFGASLLVHTENSSYVLELDAASDENSRNTATTLAT